MAEADYEVTIEDVGEYFIKRGLSWIEESLGRKVRKGILNNDEVVKIMHRISTSTSIGDAKNADLVMEATPEDVGLKRKVFKELGGICLSHPILASNTSALPIGALAAATSATRQSRVIGIYFMNPAPVMKGV